jgi:hypothetical protein
VKKNPHAVVLGRLGGLAGGRRGGLARAQVLSPERRREIAREAATARWESTVVDPKRGKKFPPAVLEVLKTYDPARLRWDQPGDRWAIVSLILVRGGLAARDWLDARMSRAQLQQLARRFQGAGLNEPDRAKIRAELSLDETAIPSRPFLGFDWGVGRKT